MNSAREKKQNYTLKDIKEEAYTKVGHKLPKTVFNDFENPNNRILAGVMCKNMKLFDLSYLVFSSIKDEGPKDNSNQHFAFVRSLIEMSDIKANKNEYLLAESLLEEGLGYFPSSMSYLMSKVHLEVYLTYYKFRNDNKYEAKLLLEGICIREINRFKELPKKDAYGLISPGLCYAHHQLSLFYLEERKVHEAYLILHDMLEYTPRVDNELLSIAERAYKDEKLEEAYNSLEQSISYEGV